MNLRTALKAPICPNVALASYSTFKIGGPARFFAEPRTREELATVLEFRKNEGLPLLVIGRGSNLLFSDFGYNGLVLSLRKLEPEQAVFLEHSRVRVPSGMGLFHLALLCQQHSLGGTEFLCHVPGTVGGAVVMNAGFGRPGDRWHEIREIVESVTAMDLDGSVKELSREQLGFGYRTSKLTGGAIVLEAFLQLHSKPEAEVEAEIRANFAYRNSVQDLRFPSGGSTFKNPETGSLTSGQLLERVGMKGVRMGDAMVSDRHANFFINLDRAKASDILKLMSMAKARVFAQFGVALEPEIKWIPSGYEETNEF